MNFKPKTDPTPAEWKRWEDSLQPGERSREEYEFKKAVDRAIAASEALLKQTLYPPPSAGLQEGSK